MFKTASIAGRGGRGASEGLTITYGSHHKVTVHLTDVFNVISIFKNCAFYSLYSLLCAALCRPHPVRMFDVHKTEEMMYMVMELAHGGMFLHHFPTSEGWQTESTCLVLIQW